MNIIIDERTGEEVKQFAEYLDAAVYRRDVLRPQLPPDAPCPYAIRGAAIPAQAAS